MTTKSNPELARLCEVMHKQSWTNEEGLRVMSFDHVRDILTEHLGKLETYEVYEMSVHRRRKTKVPRPSVARRRAPLPPVRKSKLQ